ncbi:MAG TPA: carboxypeptidase regulatory-like domain-containing protein [Pyrinomonadaceae bacterium]|nr:carboxypeptidase regulatory-like domain-containing protein [Pyrinomonadaceae bacterium]
MRRQHLFTSLIAIAVLLFGSVAASAQVAEMRGVVVTKGADGKNVPVPGAVIDIYRTDMKAKYETKTDGKGNFVFAGLPFIGTYIVVASAPNFRPQYFAGVKVSTGQQVSFLLDPGDGSRPTEDEARMAAASGPGASAEDKAKAEELRRQNEEITKSNEKNIKINEVVGRTFKAGNEALKAKRFDEAITQYNEGLAADPEQVALLTNKSFALIQRGVQRYNDAAKLSDDAAQNAARDSAKKDWSEAADASSKAVTLVKAQGASGDAEQQKNQAANKLLALLARAEAMRFVASKVDTSKADEAFAAMQEYATAETDPAKKLKGQVDAAQMYFDAGNAIKAAEAFQAVLTSNPDSLDATLGAGLALFGTGDKTKYQEAANYLQRFVDKAPDTHPLKASARESLDYLKKQENVQPQRTTGGTRRRG